MNRDELEFSISQYHDGSLPPLETRAIEELLATSAQAREILAEYQRLDGLVRRAPATPSIAWDRLHAHLSAAVANVPEEQAPAARTYKIADYRMRSWTRYVGVAAAVAAAVAIVAVVTFRGERGAEPAGPTVAGRIDVQISPSPSQGLTAIVQNDGAGTASPAASAGNAIISVGPSPQVAGMTWGYDDGILQRPPRVVIESDASSMQDVWQDLGGPIPD